MTKTNTHVTAEVLNNQLRREYKEQVQRNEHAYNLHIKISATDYDLLARVAENEERRLSDLLQLIFANGLEAHFGDKGVRFNKKEHEWNSIETAHMKRQKELTESEGWDALSWEEKRAKGYRHIGPEWRNFAHGCCGEITPEEDNLIEPMAHRIAAFARKEETPATAV